MQKAKTDLSTFNNSWYKPGGLIKRVLWYLCNVIFFNNGIFPISGIKVTILRIFGASVGKNVLIKPDVNIKYPWKLKIGDNVWIGEGVWIDNLADVSIGSNACISQGVMLLTGNHNYKKSSFDLMIGEIKLEEGVWVGARSVVGPGVICHSHAVLSVGSVASENLSAYSIYRGNPAIKVKDREIDS